MAETAAADAGVGPARITLAAERLNLTVGE
jgi:hypothetical protein